MKALTQKQQQKLESRQRLLESSAKLFKQGGFSSTGIDAVVADAGLTAGAFYAHFESKNALFEQTLEKMFEASANNWAQALEGLEGKELVETLLKKYVNKKHRDDPGSGCALPAVGAEVGRATPRTKEIVGEYVNRWIKLFAKNLGLKQSKSREELREEAIRLVAQAIGAVMLSRMVTPETLSEEILSACRKL